MLPFLARSLILIAAAIGFAALSRRRARMSVGLSRGAGNALRGKGLRSLVVADREHRTENRTLPADALSVRAASVGDASEVPGTLDSSAPSRAAPDENSLPDASAYAQADAQALSQAPLPAPPGPLDAPRGGRPDNLTLISGIGPSIERLLFENGIFHFDQIAGWSDEDARRIDALTGFSGRVARENWRTQAGRFMAKRGGEG